LQKCLTNKKPGYGEASAAFVLAMTQKQQGQMDAARKTLARAQEITRQLPALEKAGGNWTNWLINDLLRREAEVLILGEAPAPKK
jgi:hypothetical protein